MPQVEDEIARLVTEDGYAVVSRNEHLVEMERKNSWFAVVLTAVLTNFPSGGGMAFRRTDRVYLLVDENGEAEIRLQPPRAAG